MNAFRIADLQFPSPRKTLCVLLLVIFSLETLVMSALQHLFPNGNPYLLILADATLLAVLFSPALYRCIFKPLQKIAALQKSLTKNVLAHVVDGVVVFDENLVIRSFNAAAERIFGYPAAQIVGGCANRILDDAFLNSMPGGSGPADFCETDGIRACTGTRSDGTRVSLEFSLSRVHAGGSWMWLGIIRDISARKRDDDRLKHTLSLLSATLESTADGIMVRNLAGRMVISNKRFGEMWRLPEQVLATNDDTLMRAHVLDQLKDPQTFLALTDKQYLSLDEESRHLIRFKDGRVFLRFSAPQVVDESIVGRVTCYRDVTEEKNLEHQLRHAQKMEALGTLAGGVAHDFNNILTVIMGYCNLTAQADDDGPRKPYLDQIMAASERALALTNSLLVYSRKQPMNPRPLELNASLQKTEKFLARLIGEDIELVTKLCREKMVVMADSGQLEQVLMNLASNARDAMARKGSLVISTQKLEIDEAFVKLHGYGKPGAFALISVSDTGAGMDTATRDKIFEPFFTTKTVGQGTGLGLSIVYGIVKQHDGYINVYSEPGQGTTFNVFLPVIDGVEEMPCTQQQQQIASGSETILLAEDDPGVRALVTIILTGSGYQVIEARDGEDAVEKFRENAERIDLLVLDVVMPKKNGKEAYTEICAIKEGVKTIFVSGYTADIIDRNGLMQSGLHLMTKPLLPSQLLAKVREVLDG